ncbi:MAG TPA: histidine kinase, partial [Patescibacteria group bacterium]
MAESELNDKLSNSRNNIMLKIGFPIATLGCLALYMVEKVTTSSYKLNSSSSIILYFFISLAVLLPLTLQRLKVRTSIIAYTIMVTYFLAIYSVVFFYKERALSTAWAGYILVVFICTSLSPSIKMLIFSLVGGVLGNLLLYLLYGSKTLNIDTGDYYSRIFIVIFAGITGFLINRQLLNEALKNHRNSVELARSELFLLQAQIRPHFLDNILSVISYFVKSDPEKANNLIFELSDYLRLSINNTNKNFDESYINEEIALIRSYLAMQEMCFPNKLKVEYFIEDHCNYKIPHLI